MDRQPHFDGETYEPAKDHARLSSQFSRVFDCMADRDWMTLAEISDITGDPPASVSARIRDFRKPKFGSFVVGRRRREGGTFEYKLEG